MIIEYAAIIEHKILGDIHIKWTDEPLLVSAINIDEAFSHAEYVHCRFAEVRFPQLCRFLRFFAEKDIDFPLQCLNFSQTASFYREVYYKLSYIKCGHTVTYGELAAMAGSPKACRAVGNAMNKNKFLLAVPCHRVVGKGYLGNFAKGMELKKKLLRLEGRLDLTEQ